MPGDVARFIVIFSNFVSQSSQASSIAEPLILNVRLYWAMVQTVTFLFEKHHTNSRWCAYLVLFLRTLSCAQCRDQSAPVYQLGCSEAPSLESLSLINSTKA